MTNGKLDVPFADERAKLPTAEQLASYQVSAYFLGALRAIALELGEEQPWPGDRGPCTTRGLRPSHSAPK